MVATLIGRFLSAVWRVEEEHRHLQEPAPIPRHLTVERTAVTWDQMRKQFLATSKNAVSIFISNSEDFFLFLLNSLLNAFASRISTQNC